MELLAVVLLRYVGVSLGLIGVAFLGLGIDRWLG